MVMANFTGGAKQTKPLEQQLCSASLTEGIHAQFIFISAFNIFLSVTAFFGNALILVSLRKVSSLHPPSKLLLRCLATTDLCVGLIGEPLFVIVHVSVPHEQWNLCRYALLATFVVGYILCPVTLLTLTTISVDRLLILLLELRYRQVVTLKRTYVVVVTFWVVSLLTAILYLANHLTTFYYGCVITSICAGTSIVSYTKIFLTLRRHRTQVQHHTQPPPPPPPPPHQQQQQQRQQQQQPSQTVPLNIARYRKAVFSALWVQLTLVACYLPHGIVGAVIYGDLSTSRVLILSITTTLVYLNSSLNPFLYCWKIREVKQAVKQTIREALCCLSS